MNAEIVAIGTELLLGEIVDTNSAHIARTIRDIGVDLFSQMTVGDNKERVATAISTALDRADVVISTGGLGPTVDDVTRQAVATATGRKLELRPELLEQIAARYSQWGVKMSPNNRRQAYVPAGAIGWENPVGTAPCFALETERGIVISLPGVPREMTYMLDHVVIPYLQHKMDAPAVILAQVLRTAGIGESQIDAIIQDLERLSNPTVGLAAHAGQTDIRITTKAASLAQAEALIEPIARDIYDRLGINIYGEGTETIEEVLLAMMDSHKLTLALAQAGTKGLAGDRLAAVPRATRVITASGADWSHLAAELGLSPAMELSLGERAQLAAKQVRSATKVSVGLAVLVELDKDKQLVMGVGLVTPAGHQSWQRGYGGPPECIAQWASTRAFDYLRRWLLTQTP